MPTAAGLDEHCRTGTDAEWYDRSINWPARLNREIPVLTEVFGPPPAGRLLDAGCGTGHQAAALAQRGYAVVGADVSAEMLGVAQRHTASVGASVEFVCTPYATLHRVLGGGFAGVYTLANALAAAGSRQAVANALEQFARCVRAGGRLFIQILNFQPMRREEPCVRGPRVVTVDGLEYVSARHFHFFNDVVRVSNVTLWKQREWRMRTQGGVLYPIEHDELTARLAKAGFAVDALYGGYGREPFDPAASVDLIVVATRNAAL